MHLFVCFFITSKDNINVRVLMAAPPLSPLLLHLHPPTTTTHVLIVLPYLSSVCLSNSGVPECIPATAHTWRWWMSTEHKKMDCHVELKTLLLALPFKLLFHWFSQDFKSLNVSFSFFWQLHVVCDLWAWKLLPHTSHGSAAAIANVKWINMVSGCYTYWKVQFRLKPV